MSESSRLRLAHQLNSSVPVTFFWASLSGQPFKAWCSAWEKPRLRPEWFNLEKKWCHLPSVKAGDLLLKQHNKLFMLQGIEVLFPHIHTCACSLQKLHKDHFHVDWKLTGVESSGFIHSFNSIFFFGLLDASHMLQGKWYWIHVMNH